MNDHATRWIIKRNCSASPVQLALVFASIVAVSFVFGVFFAARGLWLVLPFVGLEMLAVATAFFVYGRHAADYERIEMRDGVVTVQRVEGPRSTVWHCPALWARVEVDAPSGASARDARVFIAARAERIEVGRHLQQERRAALVQELKLALRSAAATAAN
jgi:uncharacterized membrane protein